jgi:hypothetical protein
MFLHGLSECDKIIWTSILMDICRLCFMPRFWSWMSPPRTADNTIFVQWTTHRHTPIEISDEVCHSRVLLSASAHIPEHKFPRYARPSNFISVWSAKIYIDKSFTKNKLIISLSLILCEKLHNKELHNLYSSPSIIRIIKSRRIRWAGHVAPMGRRGTWMDYWWESQRGRRPLWRPRRRWVDNIRMDLGEVGWGDVRLDWSG